MDKRSEMHRRERRCYVIGYGGSLLLTLAMFGIYGLLWVFFETRIGWLGLLMAIGSAATVFTTAMIYTQLKTVPRWHTWMTPPCYLLFALASQLAQTIVNSQRMLQSTILCSCWIWQLHMSS